MIDVDIKSLASLAHIDLSPEELESFAHELPAILGFVEQIGEVGGELTKEAGILRNVMREDENPTPSGTFTETMVKAMPNSKNNYLRVKKVVKQGR